MAKVKSNNYTDTAIAGNPVLNFLRASLNFAANFKVKSNTGKEVVLVNTSSPLGSVEKIRISYSDVANVYSGTGIDASIMAPTKQGVSLLAQVTDVITVTDDTNADYRIDLPISCHMVIKIPASEHITATDVQARIGRLMSCFYDTGLVTTARLEGLLRGSLVPSDV
jgi:hypothetical protein